jgi:hypothetical protein
MVDKIRPLKLESPSDGGDELDEFQTPLDPHEDYLDARGIVIQNDTSTDEQVIVSRNANNDLTFKDAYNTPTTLTTLLAGGFDINRILLTISGTIIYVDNGDIVLKAE